MQALQLIVAHALWEREGTCCSLDLQLTLAFAWSLWLCLLRGECCAQDWYTWSFGILWGEGETLLKASCCKCRLLSDLQDCKQVLPEANAAGQLAVQIALWVWLNQFWL